MNRTVLLFAKLLAISGLALVILIALYLVDGVITDRQAYRDAAISSIASSYATDQRILGPILVQPYRQTIEQTSTGSDGTKKLTPQTIDNTYFIFPRQLKVSGVMHPSVRRHGLYRVTVYEFQGTLSGHFDVPPSALKGQVQFGIPYLAFALKDARGIVGMPVMHIQGRAYPVVGAVKTQAEADNPVRADIAKGMNLRVLIPNATDKSGGLDFSLDLTLAGTQKLDLVPLADSNRFELTSSWRQPLFAGQFLPNTREISGSGFHAVWDISSLASATQQQIVANSDKVDAASTSLNDVIDPYRLADRAVKYGILFVLLTFGGFFLFEIGKQMLIHPVQYLLVGFCQAVFFLLLVSFTEHMSFGAAYLLASAACIGLLTYYLVFVLKSKAYGLAFGGILAALYAAIYGLLISEDNALLLGSLLLFGVIAIVMIATRKIDWYQRTAIRNPPSVPPATQSADVPAYGGPLDNQR